MATKKKAIPFGSIRESTEKKTKKGAAKTTLRKKALKRKK